MDEERVRVELVGAEPVSLRRGQPLMQELRAAGAPVETDCGGRGICHLCRVWIRAGELPPPTRHEHRALGNVLVEAGMRLSCRVTVDRPLTVEIPTRGEPT